MTTMQCCIKWLCWDVVNVMMLVFKSIALATPKNSINIITFSPPSSSSLSLSILLLLSISFLFHYSYHYCYRCCYRYCYHCCYCYHYHYYYHCHSFYSYHYYHNWDHMHYNFRVLGLSARNKQVWLKPNADVAQMLVYGACQWYYISTDYNLISLIPQGV